MIPEEMESMEAITMSMDSASACKQGEDLEVPFTMPLDQFDVEEVRGVEMLDLPTDVEVNSVRAEGMTEENLPEELVEIHEEKIWIEQVPQEPAPGLEFESSEAARAFYAAYADRIGFRVRNSKSFTSRVDEKVIMRRFVCSKQGRPSKKDPYDLTKKRRNRVSSREGLNCLSFILC